MITIEETKVDGLYVRQYFPAQPIFSANKVLFLHGYPGSQKNYDLAEDYGTRDLKFLQLCWETKKDTQF